MVVEWEHWTYGQLDVVEEDVHVYISGFTKGKFCQKKCSFTSAGSTEDTTHDEETGILDGKWVYCYTGGAVRGIIWTEEVETLRVG